MFKVFVGVAGAFVLAACTTPPASDAAVAASSSARSCFWANNANGFNAVDETTVYVRVGVRDVYRLDLFARCPDIDWNQAIGLRAAAIRFARAWTPRSSPRARSALSAAKCAP